MPQTAATARLVVDLDALVANYRLLERQARGAEVAPAVKADAYGLGAISVSLALWEAGARTFFTARLPGAEALRQAFADREATIYVLDGCHADWAARLDAANLIPVLNDANQLGAWKAYGSGLRRALPAALHIDTGMNRLGMRPEEAEALADSVDHLEGVDLRLVMSHLACAGDPGHPMNRRQRDAFAAISRRFPNARKSLANSGGTFLGEDYLFDMVRPGITLYGGGPEEKPDRRVAAAARFEAEVLQVRGVGPGETVGYAAGWTAQRHTRVAVIGAGYADGAPRSASPGGGAWFAGRIHPFVGRVSMDVAAVDIGDDEDIRPGDAMELFGPNYPLDEAAHAAGTVSYELLTRVGPRVPRIYRRDRT